MKNPNEPCTPQQTWGIFKIIRRDIRDIFQQRGVTKQQASDLMGVAYAARSNSNSTQEAETAFNKALDNL